MWKIKPAQHNMGRRPYQREKKAGAPSCQHGSSSLIFRDLTAVMYKVNIEFKPYQNFGILMGACIRAPTKAGVVFLRRKR